MAISILGTPAYLDKASFVSATTTVPITVPSGTKVLLIAATINDFDWSKLTSITVNGSATGIVQAATTPSAQANRSIRFWHLVNPTAGTYNIVLTFTTSSNNGGGVLGLCLDGVDTTTPISATGVTSAGTPSSPLSTSIVTPSGSWAVGAFQADVGTPTRDPSQTVLGTDQNGHSFSYKQDATAFTMTFTGSPQIAQVVVSLNLASGGGDTTAPVLTSATGSATGATTATVGATTDEGNGTMYAICSTSATPPSVVQIQAGQTAAGAAAPWAGNVAVSSTGTKTLNATGLTASTTYYAHVQHKDAANNNSTVVTSSGFTTSAAGDTTPPTLTSPTGTATGATTANGSVSTDEANGTLYRYASTNSTETAATVKASGQTSTVSATGVQTVSFTGLTASTTYYAHYVHRDAAGNDSARVSSASFTTSSGGGGTGLFTSAVLTNSARTKAGSVSLAWTWAQGGDFGTLGDATLTEGTATTNSAGVFTATVPVGAGVMYIKSDDGTIYAVQPATVS